MAQPSEIKKPRTLGMRSGVLTRSKIGELKDALQVIGSVLFVFGIPVAIILSQPGLGSSLFFLPITFVLPFASEVPNTLLASYRWYYFWQVLWPGC
jgi:cell division protein FtsW (lipid II flippase)